jgi:hypothetical protein
MKLVGWKRSDLQGGKWPTSLGATEGPKWLDLQSTHPRSSL